MRTNLTSFVLSSEKRKAIVRTIFEYPKRQWSCPHLEDLTKVPHSTVFRTMAGLRYFRLVKSFRMNRKDIIYELVSGSPLAKELKRMLNIEEDVAKRVAHKFINMIKSKEIYGAVLYGSAVKGNFGPESDIDILIVLHKHNKIREKRIFNVAGEFSSEINKAISVIFMDLPEIRRKKDSQFLKSVASDNKILYGKKVF